MNLKLPSLMYKASLATCIFVSLWTVMCCTETGLGGIRDEESVLHSKRAPFNAWAGKRNSEKLPYYSENDKRAPFSSWAGKRDSWQEPDDVVGDVYSVEEPEVNDVSDITSNDKRPAFSSWAGKRAGFSSWAGKRGTSLRDQLQLINRLLEQAVARVVRKRMFNAWAGKRSEQAGGEQDHKVARRKFSAWHGK